MLEGGEEGVEVGESGAVGDLHRLKGRYATREFALEKGELAHRSPRSTGV